MVALDSARYHLAKASLQLSQLGLEVRAFARWVEEWSPGAVGEPLKIVIADGAARVVDDDDRTALGRWGRLWRFLAEIGIDAVILDPRLESNQVVDVLALLVAHRRSLRGGRRRRPSDPVGLLRSAEGYAIACTVVRLDGNRLSIAYSYCMTRFSMLVQWFKERQSHFSDHRALFRAAPRYAAVLGLAPLAIFGVYALHGSWTILLATSVLGSLAIGAATYVFFMTVGSVEYDNEEKAQRLRQAYGQLKFFADRIRLDMDRACEVQRRLVPGVTDMPRTDRLEWAARFDPQDEVGGDYFDTALLRDGRVAIIFADVSGHGLAAALITAILKATFESWLEGEGGIARLVRLLNRRLAALTPDESFAAVVVAVYDPEAGTFCYCNCGHSPRPYLIAAANGSPHSLVDGRAMILGVMPDITPEIETIRLEPGDTVFLATDGITESRNERDEEFGDDRLKDCLVASCDTPLPELVSRLVTIVDEFVGDGERTDDRAVLALRVRREEAAGAPP